MPFDFSHGPTSYENVKLRIYEKMREFHSNPDNWFKGGASNARFLQDPNASRCVLSALGYFAKQELGMDWQEACANELMTHIASYVYRKYRCKVSHFSDRPATDHKMLMEMYDGLIAEVLVCA